MFRGISGGCFPRSWVRVVVCFICASMCRSQTWCRRSRQHYIIQYLPIFGAFSRQTCTNSHVSHSPDFAKTFSKRSPQQYQHGSRRVDEPLGQLQHFSLIQYATYCWEICSEFLLLKNFHQILVFLSLGCRSPFITFDCVTKEPSVESIEIFENLFLLYKRLRDFKIHCVRTKTLHICVNY